MGQGTCQQLVEKHAFIPASCVRRGLSPVRGAPPRGRERPQNRCAALGIMPPAQVDAPRRKGHCDG
eukprot:2936644-Prymnesium_polylepis.2